MTGAAQGSHCNKVALVLFAMRGLLTFAAAAATATLCASPVFAGKLVSPPTIVTQTVQEFMAAFDAGDEPQMKALMANDAQVFLVREDKETTLVRALPLAGLAANIAGASADLKEPIAIRSVMVEGPVAMVWAEYSLFVNGTRSHCGVDIFTLTRGSDGWKIATITYSHITEPCEEAPAL